MKKIHWNLNIDWKSKFVDLMIVIVGITIAFKLNNWNESQKAASKADNYLKSFYEENNTNKAQLESIIALAEARRKNMDTLKQILFTKQYTDKRIKRLTTSIVKLAYYSPSTATMENINASGEFEIIKDTELRKSLIDTYNSFKTAFLFQQMLLDYINKYLIPFFFSHVHMRDFSSIDANFAKDPLFENIIISHEVLLVQLINGYQESLKKMELLDKQLSTANGKHK